MTKRLIIRVLRKLGFEITSIDKNKKWPADFERLHKEIVEKVRPYTLTSVERIYGLIEAVEYISSNKIEGDIAECGVWKGGSMLAVAETLLHVKERNRKLYLYDTFAGMPAPGEQDISYANEPAEKYFHEHGDQDNNLWASYLDSVRQTLSLSAYPTDKINYIKGKVEDTIPATMPDKIALLRLDTDWYESTKHELVHLFPRLVKGGVIIIDDYGYWKGAQKAVDEFISENKIQILLNRMDETGRIAIKQ
jgi:O-methyltransferase